MIHTISISGYRSLRDIVMPLGQLTVVTGANGSGKSSVYRALRLIAEIADDRIIASLAREGGFTNVLWAGPETISRGMREGAVKIQGTTRKRPTALKLGFASDAFSYAIELGMPVPVPGSLFNLDADIKREAMWTGEKSTPAKLIADRRGPSLQVRSEDKSMRQLRTDLSGYDSMIRQVVGPDTPAEVAALRSHLAHWRFYDQIRTDANAPARQSFMGTRTMALDPDGSDLAAAIQTIYEVGDGEALDAAIAHAFEGAKLEIAVGNDGGFQLLMHQTGILRPLRVNELSDGTLRFILLAAAILSPRPAPLLVLNEPESSLHSSVIPALASLIIQASEDSQIVTVSHNNTLVSSLLGADAQLVELYKDTGETFIAGDNFPRWTWPKR